MTKVVVKTTRRKQARRRRPRPALVGFENSRVYDHTNMVLDPCNAKIAPTAYRGMDGFVQRFARNQTVNTGTDQCFISIYYPQYNGIFTSNVPTGATVIPPVVFGTAGPGQSYLLTNSDAQRAVGACVDINYTGTELNRQGMLYMGSVKCSLFSAATTIDQLTTLLGHPQRVPDGKSSVKWIPSPIDEEYWLTGPTSPDNSGDRNAIVVIGTGFTSASPFQLVTTLIAEWQPNAGIGIASNNPNSHDTPGGLEHVRNNLQRAGTWWVTAAHTLEAGYQTAKSVYRATRGVRAGLAMLTM